MDQPPRLHHVDGAALGPLVESLPVLALVGCGVGDGDEGCGGPLEGYDADVGVAHGRLAEEVEAVFWFYVSEGLWESAGKILWWILGRGSGGCGVGLGVGEGGRGGEEDYQTDKKERERGGKYRCADG